MYENTPTPTAVETTPAKRTVTSKLHMFLELVFRIFRNTELEKISTIISYKEVILVAIRKFISQMANRDAPRVVGESELIEFFPNCSVYLKEIQTDEDLWNWFSKNFLILTFKKSTEGKPIEEQGVFIAIEAAMQVIHIHNGLRIGISPFIQDEYHEIQNARAAFRAWNVDSIDKDFQIPLEVLMNCLRILENYDNLGKSPNYALCKYDWVREREKNLSRKLFSGKTLEQTALEYLRSL